MKPVTFDESDLRKLFRIETKITRSLRRIKRILGTLIFLGIIYGAVFFALNAPAYWQRVTYKPQNQTTNTTITIPSPSPVLEEVIYYDPTIRIGKISLNAPVRYNVAYDQILTELASGTVHYQDTALPGQVGNVVIVGHSSDYPWSQGLYKNVFALLDKLSVGDQIVLAYNTKQWLYKVDQVKIVRPTDLTVLNRSSDPKLTLITCYPVGTTKSRLVITAFLVGNPNGTQESQPYLGSSLPQPR